MASGDGSIHAFEVDAASLPPVPSSSEWVWAKQGGGAGEDRGSSIAVDMAGNAYVTGILFGPTTFSGQEIPKHDDGGDIFVAKYDKEGSLLWIRQAGGSLEDRGTGIAVGPSGNVYVTGNFRGTATFPGFDPLVSSGDKDNFLAKYDSNGNLTWGRTADLRGLLAARAHDRGLRRITASPWCSHHHLEFHSHRRDPKGAGRMVAYLGMPLT